MTQEALKRIELIFQTEIKILKFPCPGLSHFSLGRPRALLRDFTAPPNCLEGLEGVDFMRVGGLVRTDNNNLRMLYLCILIMAYQDNSMRLLKRIKHVAYDQSQPLTYLTREGVPEEFRSYYDDKLLRKLFVEFFHLVASRKSANKVIRFIEYHPILDFAFQLLFKRLFFGKAPSNQLFAQHIETGQLITVLFEKLELQPDLRDRRLRMGQYRYLAQDDQNTYMTYHRQDDLDIDFTQEGISSSDSDEESGTAASTTIKVSSMKESHCDSNQTKVTEEEDPSKWNTPVKQEVPLVSQSMIPMREIGQKGIQYFKCANGADNKTDKPGGLEQYEARCGEIKDKLRKLETDVQQYTGSGFKPRTAKEETPVSTKIFPLCFKERQSERKMSSEYFDTSFFREKTTMCNNGMISSNRHISQQLPQTLVRPNELPPRPPKPDIKSTREMTQSTEYPGLIRISSNAEIPSSHHSRTGSVSDMDFKKDNTSILLRENPKKIMVRKI